MKLPQNVSESVKRRNPELYGLAGLPDPKRQSDERRQGQDRQLEQSTASVEYWVTIISIRRRKVDSHDNIRTGGKPLVDAITATLGFASDDNPRLHWDYQQVISATAKPGTIVLITSKAK